MNIKYFDHAATTAVAPEVLHEMIPYFSKNYGNASSMYEIARISKRAMNEARAKIAHAIGASPKEIYFTSCGSESDNLAIKGIAYANKEKGKHIITSKIEHNAVLNSCERLEEQGFEITYLNVDQNGFVNLEELKNAIREDTILITIMFANNEVGTIEPVEKIAEIAKNNNIIFHTDAVQAIGNVRIDVRKIGIDALSMSAHKFYGPKGIGALYVRDDVNFQRIQDGGHQERDKRAGTENVAEIVGMGKAIEMSYKNFDEHCNYLRDLRDYYIAKVEREIPNAKLNGDREKRLPGNANFSFEGLNGEKILFTLDLHGICASAGSACATGSLLPSHVLSAMGVPEIFASGTLRTTFGMENTKEDIDYLVECLKKINRRSPCKDAGAFVTYSIHYIRGF